MKLLFIDIETTPSLVYTWGLFDQNIGLSQVVKPTRMLSFAAKFQGEKRIHFHRLRSDGDTPADVDSREAMIEAAHKLIDEADAVCHYNGTSFDEKHLNREFLEAGYTPPSPYQTIDLFRTVKGRFRFLSSKLDHVTQRLGLEGKVSHEGFDLWLKCMAGDAGAWRRMERYNKRDVTLLEELYVELLPWIKGHPNLQHHNHGGCPRCGSDESIKRGFHRTAASTFQTYQCKGCGGYYRGKRAVAPATTGRSV